DAGLRRPVLYAHRPDSRGPGLQPGPRRVRPRHHHRCLRADGHRLRAHRSRRAVRSLEAPEHIQAPAAGPRDPVGSEPEGRAPAPLPAPPLHRAGVLTMGRALRISLGIVVGVLLGLVIAAIAVYMLSETQFGAERVRGFVVGRISERIQGELRVGAIRPGRLLGGAVVEDFALAGPRGRPFLQADSARIRYDLIDLLAGRWVFRDVVLYSPVVVIERLPGDTAWNYEYTFADPTPEEDEGPDPYILI